MATGTQTLAGTKIAFTASQPASGLSGATLAEYEALTWTEDDCTLENSPTIGRTYNAVSSNLVCKATNSDSKGSSKWDAITFTMESDWGNAAQTILENAEKPNGGIVSYRLTFPNGNQVFGQGEVAKFTISDGGSADDKDKRSVEIWPQMDDYVKKAA